MSAILRRAFITSVKFWVKHRKRHLCDELANFDVSVGTRQNSMDRTKQDRTCQIQFTTATPPFKWSRIDDKIEDIFDLRNRHFFFTWLMSHLNEQYCIPVNWNNQAQSSLAKYFRNSGFCDTLSEATSFVSMNPKLAKQTEIRILYKIFDFISKTREESSSANENLTSKLTNIDLTSYLGHELNLFPLLGPLHSHTKGSRQKRINQLKSDITVLQTKLAGHEDEIDKENYDVNAVDSKMIRNDFDDFEEKLSSLRSLTKKLSLREHPELISGHDFNQNVQTSLESFNSLSSTVVNYFQTANLIHDVNQCGLKLNTSLEDERISKSTRHLNSYAKEVKDLMSS